MQYCARNFSVFFGNRNNGLEMPNERMVKSEEEAYTKKLAERVSANLHSPVVLLEQTHGIAIHTVDSYSCYPAMALRSVEGDGLITTLPNIAVGMLTADCLPVVLYNSDTNALAILHAGWRGMTQGIVRQAIEKMGLQRDNCSIVLGPCARVCCYEVQKDFLLHIPETHRSSVEQRNGKFYFDLLAYARHELALYQLSTSVVHVEPPCTICDTNFYSYRREGASCTQRQATIAVLHN